MKFISLFLSALFLLMFPAQPPTNPSAPPVSSEAKTVDFGTPTLDGALDELYLESYCYELPKGENLNHPAVGSAAYNTAKAAMENTEGRVYYLYDEDYLYACAVIHDESIMSMGEEWRMNTTWPWNDDGAELYFAFSANHMFAIHTDASGIRSVVDEEIWGNNHSTSRKYHDSPKEDYAVSQGEDEYTIEIRVALDEGMTEGSTVGLFLEIDDRYSMDSTGAVGALFPKNRDVSDTAYAVTLGKKPTAADDNGHEDTQALIAYAMSRFSGILASK